MLSDDFDFAHHFHEEESISKSSVDVYELFPFYNEFFFNRVCSAVELKWSKKMT